jgi:hypothetical protein
MHNDIRSVIKLNRSLTLPHQTPQRNKRSTNVMSRFRIEKADLKWVCLYIREKRGYLVILSDPTLKLLIRDINAIRELGSNRII